MLLINVFHQRQLGMIRIITQKSFYLFLASIENRHYFDHRHHLRLDFIGLQNSECVVIIRFYGGHQLLQLSLFLKHETRVFYVYFQPTKVYHIYLTTFYSSLLPIWIMIWWSIFQTIDYKRKYVRQPGYSVGSVFASSRKKSMSFLGISIIQRCVYTYLIPISFNLQF